MKAAARAEDLDVPEKYARDVQAALDFAGDNRTQLEDALHAAKEMTADHPDAFDAMCFTIGQTRHRGFLKGEFRLDCRNISAALLRGNLRLALMARDEFPWCKNLGQAEWLRFVLPYRCTTESLVDWRAFFWNQSEVQEKVKGYAAKYTQAQTDAEKIGIFDDMLFWLNTGWLAQRVSYAPRGAPDLNPLEALEAKQIRCTDLTISLICLLRTYGIAATSVRCIWWPKEKSNHTWTCVYCPIRKKWLDIESGLPGEKNEDYFAVYRNRKNKPIAKAYRVVPGEENGAVRRSLEIPRGEFWPASVDKYLVAKPMLDVTSEYTRTATAPFNGFSPGTLLYLAVWNDNEWHAVAGARAGEDGVVKFEQVDCYVCLYLLAHCVAGELQPIAQPFTLCEDGTMKPDAMPERNAIVVVLSERTSRDAEWNAVADALVEKHKAARVVYGNRMDAVRLEVALRMPRYLLFVARPEEANQKYVKRVHQFSRALDADPYGDAQWGIITGYTATDALKLAQAQPELTVRRCLAGCGSWGNLVEEFTGYSEGKQKQMWKKEATEKAVRELEGPADATQDIVKALNADSVDMMWTSGHATEKDWQIGYSFRSGAIVSEEGKLVGASLGGERYAVESKNPKIYYAPGNCLIGNIADPKNAMCLSWLRAGAVQFVGYTVPTWYGYMGWGIADYFFQLQDTFTFSEAFFLNNQALLWDIEAGNLPADMRASPGRNKEGHMYDRDVVALYGDPTLAARLPRHATPRFTQHGSVTLVEGKEGECEGIFSIEMQRKDSLPRPAAFFFPHRLKNFRNVKHDGARVLFTDSLLLFAVEGELEAGAKRSVTFLAERMTQQDIVLAPIALEEGKLAPWERTEIHNQVILLLGRREDSAALAKAVELLARLLENDSRDVTALYNLACGYALLKDKQQALEFLEKAIEAGWDDAAHTKTDADLEILRDEPAFRKLLERMEKE